MKTKTITNRTNNLFIIVFLLFSSSFFGQTTYIPDPIFENYLETHDASGSPVPIGNSTSMGNGIANDQFVFTYRISSVTSLSVDLASISDLTGVEAFVALTDLICNNNNLTNLDVSQNIALTRLVCFGNQLSSLDVSTNTLLNYLDCHSNQITNLNLSQNLNLTILKCAHNQLVSLNIKNGNNSNFTAFDATTNPNLSCIQIDYSFTPTTPIWQKDATASYSTNCHYNETYIPDTNFEAYLEANGMGNGFADNYVTTSNINSVTSLNISNKNISDLTGIEDFSTLSFLICSDNSLTNIDVSQNALLSIFFCDNNNLTALDVSQNTSLSYLRCYNNALTTLNVSSNTSLDKLSCENNSLSTINLSQNTLLKELRINNNGLTVLDVSNNTILEDLRCHNNNLTTLDVSVNTLLETLVCSYNSLTNIDVSQNTALSTLGCSFNSLTNIDVSQNTALSTLNCSSNLLTNIDVSQNTSLSGLHCFNNALTQLKVNNGNNSNFTAFDATTNPNLSCIEIDNGFTPTTPTWQKDATASYSTNCHFGQTYVPDNNFEAYLETHDENGNIVNSALSMGNGISGDHYVTTANINMVANLNVSNLTISDLTGIEDFTALDYLNCSSNNLTNLDVSQNNNLSNFSCSFNQLTTIALNQNLTILTCHNNLLTSLDLSNNPNLQLFICSDNLLNELNIKNGFNTNIVNNNFEAGNNPNLTCIEVDDPTWSTTNWTNIDAIASFNTNCHYNETYIPDTNFEAYLETHDANENVVAIGSATSMGNGIANDNYVTTSNINSVTTLNISSKNISDLTGIKDFLALSTLYCSDNSLTNIDVSQNTALSTLSCYDNLLTNIDVSQNTALSILDCDNNTLTTLNLSTNTLLETLDCSLNSLTNIDVSQNTALSTLSCSSNLLTNIDVSQNTALSTLDCSYNLLTNIDVSQNTALYNLDCSNNTLTQLKVNNGNNSNFTVFDATTNPNLSCIEIDNGFTPTTPSWQKDATASYSTNCHFNDTYIPDTNFEAYLEANGMGNGIANDNYVTTSNINSVTTLRINNKNISDLTGIEDFIALTNLDCEYNQLTTVDFSSNTALVTLRCNNNQIANLDLLPNITLQNLYCNDNLLTNLQISPGSLVNLYCENNQISLLDLSSFFNLANVHCFNNNISSLNLLNSAGNLIDFRCNNNQLTSLNIDANINLTTLYCGNNQLTNLVVTTNTALEDLRCNNNLLTNLTVDLNTSLRVLLCNHNAISNIDVTHNTALTDFYCNNNQLTNLDVSQNLALIELRCNNNQLSSLVSPSSVMQFLNCNDNNITNLDVSQNNALVDLKCAGNQLSDLDVSANTTLVAFNCSANNLNSLNLKNGNNSNMTNAAFDATGNANLTCIEVDNVAYSTTNWTNIDAQTNFSLNCHFGQTYVPDNNFEQALINLGYDVVLDDYVTTSNISNLATLDVSLKNISDLTGIEDFVGLVNLNCSANNLTNLDVTNNTALSILSCGANNLTNLDVQLNVALTELVVTQNQLSGIDVTQNVNLLFLACESNPFTSGLDITHNTLLQNLIVNNLNLSALDISLNDDLQTIDCNNNAITTLDFTGKQDLQEIRCQNNNLTDLYLRENPALNYIDCSNNLLSDLTIDNGNNTAIIGNNFHATNNANLTCIQVDNVAFSTTNWTNIDAIANFSTNCSVPVGSTYIPDNNFENYLETHDANENVVAIGSATSMGNGIANDNLVLTNRINSVTSLFVGFESISDLTGIEDFSALSFLVCSNNSLTNIDVSQNTALSILYCSDNLLTNIDVSQNTALSDLDCSNNTLTTLNVSSNTNLVELFCEGNSLSTINLSQNTMLTKLRIGDNGLTVLDVSNNTILKDLRCYNNNLTTLDVSVNTLLETLVCYNNSLSNIDVSQNSALSTLNCSSNLLTNIDVSQNTSLSELRCSNNALTQLKVNNGNNSNFTAFNATTNPNLSCIEVDDITIPSTPTWQKDATASYSTNCGSNTKIWEFGQWTNGAPTLNDNAIIRDDYFTTIFGIIEANTLTIDATKTVMVFPNDYIKLQSNLNNNGTLIIQNTGSFVQVDNAATNTGSGVFKTVIETTPLLDENRFTYFSSPSQTETLSTFSSWANMSRIWNYNATTQNWNLLNGTEPMTATKGYAVKPAASNVFPLTGVTEFTGPFNNGMFSQPLVFNPGGTSDDNILVGNPYPSAIDASLLLNNNPGTNAFYFWTHKSALGTGGYVADDYAIWNNLGGIASASGSAAPIGYIASGQGFFVEANASGTLVFENSMRVVGFNSDFRRNSTTHSNQDATKIWINLTTNEGYFSQLLIGFVPQGSDGFDPTYDATRVNGGTTTSFYSIGENNEHFGIESRGILEEEKIIPLGIELSAQVSSNFTLSVDHFENLEDVSVFLRDNLLGQLYDLRLANYTFHLDDLGTFDNRFELVFNRSALSTNDLISEDNLILTNVNENEIGFKMNNGSIMKHIKAYDVLGKLIIDVKPNNQQVSVNTTLKQGTILFINTILENGQTISKKFVK